MAEFFFKARKTQIKKNYAHSIRKNEQFQNWASSCFKLAQTTPGAKISWKLELLVASENTNRQTNRQDSCFLSVDGSSFPCSLDCACEWFLNEKIRTFFFPHSCGKYINHTGSTGNLYNSGDTQEKAYIQYFQDGTSSI